MLVLVVGPSGAGKDTLLDGARAAFAGDPGIVFVRRAITRPEDAGGEAHAPLSEADFAARERAGGFALSWRAHGLAYGIPASIAADLAAGRVVIANVSRTVIEEAAAKFPVHVIEITAPPEILAARLAARGREDQAMQAARLSRAVMLPEGVAATIVLNDATPAIGIERFRAAIAAIRAASPVRRS